MQQILCYRQTATTTATRRLLLYKTEKRCCALVQEIIALTDTETFAREPKFAKLLEGGG